MSDQDFKFIGIQKRAIINGYVASKWKIEPNAGMTFESLLWYHRSRFGPNAVLTPDKTPTAPTEPNIFWIDNVHPYFEYRFYWGEGASPPPRPMPVKVMEAMTNALKTSTFKKAEDEKSPSRIFNLKED